MIVEISAKHAQILFKSLSEAIEDGLDFEFEVNNQIQNNDFRNQLKPFFAKLAAYQLSDKKELRIQVNPVKNRLLIDFLTGTMYNILKKHYAYMPDYWVTMHKKRIISLYYYNEKNTYSL